MRTLICAAAMLMGALLATAPVTAQSVERTSHIVRDGRTQLEAELVVPVGDATAKAAVVFVGGSGTANFSDYVPGFTDRLVESIFLPRMDWQQDAKRKSDRIARLKKSPAQCGVFCGCINDRLWPKADIKNRRSERLE